MVYECVSVQLPLQASWDASFYSRRLPHLYTGLTVCSTYPCPFLLFSDDAIDEQTKRPNIGASPTAFQKRRHDGHPRIHPMQEPSHGQP